MRVLGYPNPIGIDSFDTPNFSLMANLLQWLASLYDPDLVVISDLSNENGRVEFVKSIVQQMAVRSGIRLNPKKLYSSDRFAVRELLKISAPIYSGITSKRDPSQQQTKQMQTPSVQKISQLSSTIPKHSVELYDQLEKELMIRDNRTKILSTMPPLEEVEKSVISSVEAASNRLETLTKELERLNSDEDSLRSKIKKRKYELDRQSKRLVSVTTIRPAYMDEYEALEQELQELFKLHFQHYRNVDYFEHELQKAAEKQKEKRKKSEKEIGKIKKKIRQSLASSIEQSIKIGNVPQMDGNDFGIANGGDDTDDSF
ncbi:clusterin associated protein [Histomonas meleagridis]|uniref:clusterin associated protein n=1 Tax=Histomonas meleagridis TaxID=135588 RepID=UPI00355AB8E0|nr:clusterin associated protein [Histomonas meleagridis]KAH0801890.1 clusterin associated protein [Histomonas meleagridis]